jgi:predicted ATP-grasp superfamily ATP-dependent carboligase
MKNTLTLAILLLSLISYSQTYPFTGKVTDGQIATVWDNDYRGNIYVKNDTIFITPNNENAAKFAYRILKSKTKIVGSGKKGKTVTSYSVESTDILDDDIKTKMILTLYNKPHKVIGSRVDNMEIIFRDTFTETNSVVRYYIVR